MRLLLLDYISYTAHKTFNRIHVDALAGLGHELHLVGRKGQFDNIDNKSNVIISEIPERFYTDRPISALSFRARGIATLLWAKANLNWNDYDVVIILTYDILSLFVLRIKPKTVLINHNNVQQLRSKLKLFLTRRLPPNYVHVALNEEMERRMKDLLPDRHIFHVPHGVCLPTISERRPTFVKDCRMFLFCPVNRNYDPSFVRSMIESFRLQDYLQEKGITLFIKDSIDVECSSSIIKVPAVVEKSEYDYMIQNSLAVLLPYDKDFKYRCSGIFFECVSSQTPVVATGIDAMRIYENVVEMKTFTDVDSLIAAIEYYVENSPRRNDLKIFDPREYWRKVLNVLTL